MPARKGIIHKAFVFSVIAKGIDSLLEIAGGIILFLVSPANLSSWIVLLTRHELSEDPDDFLFSRLAELGNQLSYDQQLFAAIYLASHGVVKSFVIVALLQRKLWAYPVMILVLFVFILYQLYRYNHTHSIWLLWLSAFDIAVVFLTWAEYRRLRSGQMRHFSG